ncbi:hypothetical protein CBL_20694 [Carabus blaptoides fortunei]
MDRRNKRYDLKKLLQKVQYMGILTTCINITEVQRTCASYDLLVPLQPSSKLYLWIPWSNKILCNTILSGSETPHCHDLRFPVICKIYTHQRSLHQLETHNFRVIPHSFTLMNIE